MTNQTEMSVLLHLATASQIALGIVFFLSALPKLRRPLTFARSVIEYKILPTKIASVFALAIIPLDALLAISFLTSWLTDITLPFAAVMLITFLIAVGINLRRDRKISCGCFGESNEHISPYTLARLFLLLAAVLFLMVFRTVHSTPLPNLAITMASPLMFTYFLLTAFLAAFLLLLGSWILSLPKLIFLIRRSP